MTTATKTRERIALTSGATAPDWDSSGGYRDDYSRSNRSAEAIAAFEVPKSFLTRAYINRFIAATDASLDVAEYLRSLPVSMWKRAAEGRGPASWHHTSGWYNATNHYSLVAVANHILKDRERAEKRYRVATSKNPASAEVKRVQVGVITVAMFNGQGRNASFAGYASHYGVQDGDWFYYRDKAGATRRFKADGSRVERLKTFDSVRALVAAHSNYKGAGTVLRALAKERKAIL